MNCPWHLLKFLEIIIKKWTNVKINNKIYDKCI
jgi:hypothetical protein